MRYLLSVTMIAAALGGCLHRGETPVVESSEPTTTRADDEAGVAASAAAFEANKAAYLTRLEGSIAELAEKIAAYKAAAPEDPAQRETHWANVASLEGNLARTKEMLEAARDVGVSGWDRQQRQLEQSFLTTQAAYDAASTIAH